MGMTIDKAISHLDTYSSTMGSGQTTQEQHEEAKRIAVDTMRKYQKITKIAKAHKNGATGLACMNEICEVIEDGKID